jgi:serine protease Do
MQSAKCGLWPALLLLHFAFCILHFTFPFPAFAAEDLTDSEQQAFRAAVDRVAPSVVRIETVGGAERVGRVLFGVGPTTGLVLTADGYVVSSAFNFVNRPASIQVQLPDGTRKEAKLVATDHNRMFALLKIEPGRPLVAPEIAPPGEIRVGQWAIAVGRTFELGRPNMAVGVVSAKDRIWGKAIQTDAAVSPNSYGGPLIDVRGRVLGLLVPLSPMETSEFAGVEWYDSGIGFAIPAQTIMELLPRLKQGKDLLPGVVGISIPPQNLFTGEPLLAAVRPRSPAQQAGLKAGDRVVEVEGLKITLAAQLKQELARRYAGDKIRMVVLRDGKRIERQLDLVAKLEPYEHPFLGILPIRPATAKGEKAQEDAKGTKGKKGEKGEKSEKSEKGEKGEKNESPKPGVEVRYVYPDSPAAKAGVERGDFVASLGGEAIRGAAQLRELMSQHVPDDSIEIELRRGAQTRKVVLKLAALPEDLPAADLPPAVPSPSGPPTVPSPSGRGQGEGRPPQPATKPSPVGRIALGPEKSSPSAVAYVPERYRAEVAHGLVVWLAGPEGMDEKALIAQWKPLCDRHDLILLTLKPAELNRWGPSDLRGVVASLAEITPKYTIDATRVAIYGREAAGKAALELALAANSPLRGVAVVDAAAVVTPPENDPAWRRAFYFGASQNSPASSPMKGVIARLRAMKYPVTVKDLGPDPRPLTAEELAELARWIDTLDRI